MSTVDRIHGVREATTRLEVATRSWPTIEPNVAALELVVCQSDAIARGLRELRLALHTQRSEQAAA